MRLPRKLPSPAAVLASGRARRRARRDERRRGRHRAARERRDRRAEERRGDDREDQERERDLGRHRGRERVVGRRAGTARCAASTSDPGRSPTARPAPRARPERSGVSGREQVAAETPLTSASPKNLTRPAPPGKKVPRRRGRDQRRRPEPGHRGREQAERGQRVGGRGVRGRLHARRAGSSSCTRSARPSRPSPGAATIGPRLLDARLPCSSPGPRR